MAKKKKPIKAPKAKATAVKKAKKVVAPNKAAKKAAPPKAAKKAAVKVAKPGKVQKLLKVAKAMKAAILKPAKAAKPTKPSKTAQPAKSAVVAAKSAKAVKVESGNVKKINKLSSPLEKSGDKKDAKKAKTNLEKTTEPDVVVERPAEREMFLTDAEGRRLCKVKDCDQLSVVEFYCRYHYLLFWKKIQNRKKILSEGKLEQYIEELTSRYPNKFLELIRKDLHTEADFMSAIQELDIDENSNLDDFEEDENFIDEVRGISAEAVDRTDDEF